MKLFTISVISISSLAIGSMTWAAASENNSTQRNQPTATVTDGVIAGCWSAKTGKLKIKSIDSTELQTCPRGSQRIAWNKQGAQGLTGPEGPEGEKGERGLTGFTGETGARGPRGETGPEGPQGLQGIKGDDGDPGVTGPQGERGPSGISAAYVGTNSIRVPAGKYIVTTSFTLYRTVTPVDEWFRCAHAASGSATVSGSVQVPLIGSAKSYPVTDGSAVNAVANSASLITIVDASQTTTLTLNCTKQYDQTGSATINNLSSVAVAVDAINP